MERLKDLRAEAADRAATALRNAEADPAVRADRAGDHELPPEVSARIVASVPANTRRAWASRWARYQRWCQGAGYEAPMPPTSAMLAAYLDYLGYDQGLKPGSLEAHLGSLLALTRKWCEGECAHRAAVRAEKLARRIPLTEEERAQHDPQVPGTQLARMSINARSRAVAQDPSAEPGPRQATALSPQDVKRIVAAIDTGTPTGKRDKALILLWFKMGRRGAEAAGINLNDVTAAAGAHGLRVRVRKSKTDPAGRKLDTVRVPASTDKLACPVRAVAEWREYLIRKKYVEGPLFPRIDQAGRIGVQAASPARRRGHDDDGRIAPQSVYAILRKRAEAAGLQVSGLRATEDGEQIRVQISAHSVRRGFVTAAFDHGADAISIARHAGFADGSKILYRYRDDSNKGWEDNAANDLL